MNFYKFKKLWCILLLTPLIFATSCGDDDPAPAPDPTSSFQFDISEANFLQVTFTSFAANAVSWDWSFGDGNSSTEENPTHTYAAAGSYTVSLTVMNEDDVEATKSESFVLTDPQAALKLLTGDVSKTWKLFREGTSMSLGPDAANPAQWWEGLTNNGTRPCLYEQEFTFALDGTYTFDDKGMFWGEFGVFGGIDGVANTDKHEICFEATAANMVNADGNDVSAWLSGNHEFTYDPSNGSLTLTGMGAWIGIPKLGTTGETRVPVSSVTTKITIEERTGYDFMLVEFIYDGVYWPIRYASYSDASLEPDLVTEDTSAPFGEDLDNIAPTELSRTFASADAADFVLLDTIQSGSTIVYGVDDPAGGATKVGQFNRTTAQFQELQFQVAPDAKDIDWTNMTTVTLDVYIPSTNDYSGGLSQAVVIGVADKSNTEQWWTDHRQFENDGTSIATDQWVTLTYQLNAPNGGAGTYNIHDRTDLDMIFIQIGGGDHSVAGTFYVRNLKFQ